MREEPFVWDEDEEEDEEDGIAPVREYHFPFATVPESLLFNPAISSNAKVLWAILDRHGHGHGNIYPKRERLRKLMGVSTDTVDRAVKELVAAGALVVERRLRKGGGGYTTNLYRLCEPTPQNRDNRLRKNGISDSAPMRRQEREQEEREQEERDPPPLPLLHAAAALSPRESLQRDLANTILGEVPQKHRYDSATISEAEHTASLLIDLPEPPVALAKAIKACRDAGLQPYPGNIRKKLPKPPKIGIGQFRPPADDWEPNPLWSKR